MQEAEETLVLSLGWEDPFEKGMATYSIILAWRIQWTEEPEGVGSFPRVPPFKQGLWEFGVRKEKARSFPLTFFPFEL